MIAKFFYILFMSHIINSLDINNHFSNVERTIIIGNFDGVHLGNQSLIKQANIIAKDDRLACITFSPHSQNILNPNIDIKCNLFNIQNKYDKLFNNGVQEIFVIDNPDFFQLSAEAFIEHILIKQICCCNLVVGKDFTFGLNRSGDINLLLKYEKLGYFRLYVIDTLINQEYLKISSTIIREYLSQGNISKANELLGYSYYIEGKVTDSPSYPIINIDLNNIFQPKYGAYISSVKYKQQCYTGTLNIGITPTFLINKSESSIINVQEKSFTDFAENLPDETVKIIPEFYELGDSR